MSSKTAQARKKPHSDKLDRALDEALGQTFPASDPFTVGQITANEPPSRPVNREAPGVVPVAVAESNSRRRRSQRAA